MATEKSLGERVCSYRVVVMNSFFSLTLQGTLRLVSLSYALTLFFTLQGLVDLLSRPYSPMTLRLLRLLRLLPNDATHSTPSTLYIYIYIYMYVCIYV